MVSLTLRATLWLALGFSTGSLRAQGFKVPDGTSLRLVLTESLSSATDTVDKQIHFEVTEDVKLGETLVFPKGTTAVGHIVELVSRRRMGRSGKLNFTLDHVKAPDGTNVRLRASSTRQGDDKSGTVIIGTVLLSQLFLIMRGKDVEIPKGTAVTAYVDGDREINLARGATHAPSAPHAQATPLSEIHSVSVSFKSMPDGADIIVDGKFIGSTPSVAQLPAGERRISIEKSAFKAWQRTVVLNPGSAINLNATLEKAQ